MIKRRNSNSNQKMVSLIKASNSLKKTKLKNSDSRLDSVQFLKTRNQFFLSPRV